MYEYIATLKNGLSLTPEIKAYFFLKEIQIKKHYKKLGILKITAARPLQARQIEYIEALELERVFKASDSEEE